MKEKRILAKHPGNLYIGGCVDSFLGGFNYSAGYGTEFVVLRQIINFAVDTFVFMAGYFVNVDALSDKEFSYKHWIIYRGATVYPIYDLVATV